jgi:1,4-dihydroxy-2-naphthoate octaprenyltransferase
VNAGHLRIRSATGARAGIVWLSLLTCLAMFCLLMIYIVREQPAGTWIALVAMLALSFAIEVAYRRRTGRTLVALIRREV